LFDCIKRSTAPLRFVDRVLPCAAEPLYLGAMHEAGAAETDQLGLFGAPSPQG
jgi:hypothetical protein